MATAGYAASFYFTSTPSVSLTDVPMTDAGDHKNYSISDSAKRYLDRAVAVVVQTSPDGTIWTTVTTGFTLYHVDARVVFASAQPSGTQVRLASGSYFPYAALGGAHTVDFSGKMNMIDVSEFTTAGTEAYIPGLLSGQFKVSKWWIDETLDNFLIARTLLACSFVLPSGNRYDGYVWLSDTDLKADVKSAVTDDLTFQVTDEFFVA